MEGEYVKRSKHVCFVTNDKDLQERDKDKDNPNKSNPTLIPPVTDAHTVICVLVTVQVCGW